MAQTRAGELSASMAVLGLLVQESDCITGVGRRLCERFPQARFARNAAYNSVPSLERQGLLRLVEAGAERGWDRYEATEAGVAHLRAWMRASQAILPALRDGLRASLEQIATQADLLAALASVREQERACVAEYEAALGRYRLAGRAAGRLRSTDEEPDLSATVRYALLADEVNLWGLRAARLKRLRESLDSCDEDDNDGLRASDS